ncbi:hypothetical protein [Oryza sativa Japonica Group]|uniref:Uncharacterized protein n=1 Tax=Oryza sativa subsp. japonica TaxID=39947 RepID=Q5ZDU6_ORYSJ|nr:hypothetical protein DAI22_01g009908 [Oryza sativa Japonica Group]BAD52560.1 hypothetical protein [Oryza sativa Japonica Group]
MRATARHGRKATGRKRFTHLPTERTSGGGGVGRPQPPECRINRSAPAGMRRREGKGKGNHVPGRYRSSGPTASALKCFSLLKLQGQKETPRGQACNAYMQGLLP